MTSKQTHYSSCRAPTVGAQWFANGDFPNENPVYEGNVVRYYRSPSLNGEQRCAHCENLMHDHGFIDQQDSVVVCPGDFVFSLEDVDAKNPKYYALHPREFRAIYGRRRVQEYQMENEAFKRGDSTNPIFKHWIRDGFIPVMLCRMGNLISTYSGTTTAEERFMFPHHSHGAPVPRAVGEEQSFEEMMQHFITYTEKCYDLFIEEVTKYGEVRPEHKNMWRLQTLQRAQAVVEQFGLTFNTNNFGGE